MSNTLSMNESEVPSTVNRRGLLELVVHGQRCPVFLYRPGLAVYPSGGSPLGVLGANLPEIHPSGPHDPAPLMSIRGNEQHGPVNGLLDEKRDCWHFHQLFRELRLTEDRTLRDGVLGDLGHVDNLLGHRVVEELEHVHQLVHHLRHRSVEIEHRHGDKGLDHLLRGVPLDPLLRPPRLDQTGRPQPAGLFLKELEELRLGRRGPLSS